MLRKVAILLAVAGLGAGSAVALAACGEDREGDVQFEGDTGTSTGGTTGASTFTTPTETVPETETQPETETEVETGDSGGAEAP